MKTLIKFELFKIIKKRMNIGIIGASFILTLILFGSNILQYVSTNTNGQQVRGISAINAVKSTQNKNSKIMSEKQIKQDISDYQNLYKDETNLKISDNKKVLNDDVYSKKVLPNIFYLGLINTTYAPPNHSDFNLNKIQNLDLKNDINFYEQRNKKVNDLLTASYENGGFNQKEQRYWKNKNSEITTPYTYGYHEGWKLTLETIELFILVILCICICLAPMFAGEYQSGTDNIILTSKYGRSRLIHAKLIASYLFATVIFILNIVLGLSMLFLFFGTNGFNLPIQLLNSIIPYNYTFLSATLICLFTLYLVMITFVSFTLVLSANLKSSFQVLIIIICAFLIPMFLKLSDTNWLWNKIYLLLPTVSGQSVFWIDSTNYIDYNLFGSITNIITMRILLYGILPFLLTPLAFYSFKKHEIESK